MYQLAFLVFSSSELTLSGPVLGKICYGRLYQRPFLPKKSCEFIKTLKPLQSEKLEFPQREMFDCRLKGSELDCKVFG